MRFSVHIGGRRGPRKEKRVPRNRNRNHYRSGRNTKTISSSKGKFFFGLIFVAIALLFLLISINNANKTKDYIVTDGYVVDYYEKWDSDSDSYMWAEIVEYTVDGKIYECISSSYSNTPLPYRSRVNVYYNPVNPRVAVVNQKSNNLIIYIVCGVLGLAGLAVMFSGVKGFISGDSKESV